MCNDKFYNDVDTKSINKRLGIVRSWLLGNRSDFIVFSNSLVASFPSLPRFSVLRFALTIIHVWIRKGGEKRGRSGIMYHVLYVKWM